jgi:hypothetical protein
MLISNGRISLSEITGGVLATGQIPWPLVPNSEHLLTLANPVTLAVGGSVVFALTLPTLVRGDLWLVQTIMDLAHAGSSENCTFTYAHTSGSTGVKLLNSDDALTTPTRIRTATSAEDAAVAIVDTFHIFKVTNMVGLELRGSSPSGASLVRAGATFRLSRFTR